MLFLMKNDFNNLKTTLNITLKMSTENNIKAFF